MGALLMFPNILLVERICVLLLPLHVVKSAVSDKPSPAGYDEHTVHVLHAGV